MPRSMSGMRQHWCSPAGVIAPDSVRKMQQSSATLRRISSNAVRSWRPT